MKNKSLILSLVLVLFALVLSVFGVNVKADVNTNEALSIEGVSVRTTGADLIGIRFVAEVDGYEGVNVTAYGVSIAFGEAEAAEITMGGTVNGKDVLSAQVSETDANKYYINMINIPTTMYGQVVTARSYVVDNGEVVYSTTAVTKSLAQATLDVANAGVEGENIDTVMNTLGEGYKSVYTDSLGNLFVTDPVLETNPVKLGETFIADWNSKFGTELTEFKYNTWAASAKEGYGEGTGMTANGDTDCSGTNAYEFFVTDEKTSAKWQWLLTFLLSETDAKVHPKRQINALLNNGSYTDSYGGGLQQFAHLSRSLQNFFAGDGSNIYGIATGDVANKIDVIITDLSVYNKLADYNPGVFAKDAAYVAIESDYDFAVLNKTGYEFAGYTDGTNDYYANVTISNESLFLEPKFNAINYTVQFYNGEVLIDELSTSYTIEDSVVLPTEFEVEGYKFGGWYDNSEFAGDPITTIEKGTTGILSFYAKLEEAFTVTYNLNGGTLRYNSFAEMSTDFMADYNAVTGKNTTADQLYEAGNVMTTFFADEEMYAKWSWTIQLFYDLGELGYGKHTEAQAQYEAILAGETPSAQWAIRQNMEGLMTMTAAGGYSTSIAINFTLAEVQTKVLGYINNGVETVKYSETVNELPVPYNPGYEFNGWVDAENTPVTSVSESAELYASWIEGTYTVTYVLNNNAASLESTEWTVPCMENYTLFTPTYDSTAWEFNGWYADEDCTILIANIPAINDNDVTVYGKWTELSGYIVNYNFNGGNTQYDTREAMVDAFLVDAMTKFSKTSKPTTMLEFATVFSSIYGIFSDVNYSAKWAWLKDYVIAATDVDNTKTQLTNGNEAFWRYSLGAFLFKEQRTSWPVSENFTLEEKYDGFWEELSATEKTQYAVDAGTAPLTAVYKPGYTLAGWYTTEDFQEGTKVTSITADCTLYAKWESEAE